MVLVTLTISLATTTTVEGTTVVAVIRSGETDAVTVWYTTLVLGTVIVSYSDMMLTSWYGCCFVTTWMMVGVKVTSTYSHSWTCGHTYSDDTGGTSQALQDMDRHAVRRTRMAEDMATRVGGDV